MDRGIYAIINIINDNMYIGSAVSFKLRWKNHQVGLRTGKHYNKHLLSAYVKHGETSFIYAKLEVLSDKENLIKREQWWMDALKPVYNKAPNAGSALGVKHSAETKAKLSVIRKGQKRSDQARLNIGIGGKGRVFTEQHKFNLSLAHKGKSQSDETKAKRSIQMRGNQFNKGRKHSAEEIEMRRLAVAHGKMKAKAIRHFVASAEHYFKISLTNSWMNAQGG